MFPITPACSEAAPDDTHVVECWPQPIAILWRRAIREQAPGERFDALIVAHRMLLQLAWILAAAQYVDEKPLPEKVIQRMSRVSDGTWHAMGNKLAKGPMAGDQRGFGDFKAWWRVKVDVHEPRPIGEVIKEVVGERNEKAHAVQPHPGTQEATAAAQHARVAAILSSATWLAQMDIFHVLESSTVAEGVSGGRVLVFRGKDMDPDPLALRWQGTLVKGGTYMLDRRAPSQVLRVDPLITYGPYGENGANRLLVFADLKVRDDKVDEVGERASYTNVVDGVRAPLAAAEQRIAAEADGLTAWLRHPHPGRWQPVTWLFETREPASSGVRVTASPQRSSRRWIAVGVVVALAVVAGLAAIVSSTDDAVSGPAPEVSAAPPDPQSTPVDLVAHYGGLEPRFPSELVVDASDHETRILEFPDKYSSRPTEDASNTYFKVPDDVRLEVLRPVHCSEYDDGRWAYVRVHADDRDHVEELDAGSERHVDPEEIGYEGWVRLQDVEPHQYACCGERRFDCGELTARDVELMAENTVTPRPVVLEAGLTVYDTPWPDPEGGHRLEGCRSAREERRACLPSGLVWSEITAACDSGEVRGWLEVYRMHGTGRAACCSGREEADMATCRP